MAIDILESKVVGTNKETWYKLIGTPEDTKPTGEFPAGTGHTVAKNSTFFEIGTQIRYEFDGTVWNPKGQVPVTLIEKEITQNGVYSASDDNADGYSEVTVNVPQDNNAKFKSANSTSSPTSFRLSQNLEKIAIPNGVESIYPATFQDCTSLNEVSFPDTLISIGQNAFNYCTSLTSIEIPASVTSIASEGMDAFKNCSNLTEIIVHQNQATSPIASGAPWGATNATVTWTG